MEPDLIRACLADPDELAARRFPVFREVARLANDERTVATAREFVIRLLAHKATLPEGYDALLDALVREVGEGSTAAGAGLEQGDVITRIDDRAITDADSLVATIRSYRPGDEVQVTWQRNGEQTATLELDTDAATG